MQVNREVQLKVFISQNLMCLMKSLLVFITVQTMIIILLQKKFAKEFDSQFECLGENTEKYKAFYAPIEKEVTNTDKDYNKSVVTISYKIKFIDSTRFMARAGN